MLTFALLPDRGDPAGGLRAVPGAQPTDLWLRLTDQSRPPPTPPTAAPDSTPDAGTTSGPACPT